MPGLRPHLLAIRSAGRVLSGAPSTNYIVPAATAIRATSARIQFVPAPRLASQRRWDSVSCATVQEASRTTTLRCKKPYKGNSSAVLFTAAPHPTDIDPTAILFQSNSDVSGFCY